METRLKLQLHGAIYRPDSFVMMLRYNANLKAIRYESTSLNRIVTDKSHCVIVALSDMAKQLLTPLRLIARMNVSLTNYGCELFKATITRCDLSPRFFCTDATLLCKFESDKI